MTHHALAWLTWTVSASALALLTRNPLYIALIAMSAWLTLTVTSEGSAHASQWRGLLKLGLFIWALTIPFNVLMIHAGQYVLFRLPRAWPLVGGNITLEALLSGAVSGFALWTLLLIFASLNVAADTSQLLRFMPGALHQVGMVASIALTFVPQMLASAQEIREAQMIRGHRFRGWRDLLPLFVPLLTTSLERAIQLAESMESRGYGGRETVTSQREQARQRVALFLGLALALCGLVGRSYWPQRLWMGNLLVLMAIFLVLSVLRAVGRQVQRSRYLREVWEASDSAVVLFCAIALALPLIVRAGDKLSLTYYPFPPYGLAPEFNLWTGAAISLLSMPALMQMFRWPEAVPQQGNTARHDP